MGRQKQNKPRRERPQVPHHQLTAEQAAEQLTAIAQAEEIELPPIVSSGQKGTVLDVASVGRPDVVPPTCG
ncbi:hypothetical protein [Actinacidiphila oryziradicis]|uniref:Uncharacterized protein n=1 Tax=Actinacidiphila oryziradicis TaxID=2571141 RepID=A0A4V5N0F9_9ACTN|nr:hypothetical protein [Actinacidiphila oryziradicis]TKA11789.1 hypothetical protein FCI23_10740 [Actinacidiphila oryziradicis]